MTATAHNKRPAAEGRVKNDVDCQTSGLLGNVNGLYDISHIGLRHYQKAPGKQQAVASCGAFAGANACTADSYDGRFTFVSPSAWSVSAKCGIHVA